VFDTATFINRMVLWGDDTALSVLEPARFASQDAQVIMFEPGRDSLKGIVVERPWNAEASGGSGSMCVPCRTGHGARNFQGRKIVDTNTRGREREEEPVIEIKMVAVPLSINAPTRCRPDSSDCQANSAFTPAEAPLD